MELELIKNLLNNLRSEIKLYNSLPGSPLKSATLDHMIETINHLRSYKINIHYSFNKGVFETDIETVIQNCK